MDTTKEFAGKHILLVIENEAVPFDRRMWNIARALREAGARVSVICPVFGRDSEKFVVLEGIEIHRYANVFADGSVMGYFREYGTAFIKTFFMLHALLFRGRIHAIHVANPPDIFWPLALYVRLFGVKFIFDEHDLAPEAYLSRFEKDPEHPDLLFKVQRLFQSLSYRFSHAVLSTNETYQAHARKQMPSIVPRSFIVRNGPDLRLFNPRPAVPALKKGKSYVAAFIGVMAIQDGVEYILRAVHDLVHARKFTDFVVYLIGKGDDWDRLKVMAEELKIGEYLVFTGRIPDPEALDILCTADVCLSPDPYNSLNDVSTMTKVMEYMALGKPTVSYRLKENTYSAGDAALYVDNNDPVAFAGGMLQLFQDADLRARLGAIGRQRIEERFSWQRQTVQLKAAYEAVWR